MPQTKERHKQYKNLVAEVTKDFYDEVTEMASQKGMTKSEFIRLAVRKAVSEQKAN